MLQVNHTDYGEYCWAYASIIKNTIQTRRTSVYLDWLSRHNHEINKDEEISGMQVTINAITSYMDIQDLHDAEKSRTTMLEDKYPSALAELMLCSWPSTGDEVLSDMQPYWLYIHS